MPSKKPEKPEWDGREITVGAGISAPPALAVTPRLVGPAVDNFKRLMGVCLHEGCMKIHGHTGEHS
jgi:hypothetical protein